MYTDHDYELEEKQERELERQKDELANLNNAELIDLTKNFLHEIEDTIKEQVWLELTHDCSLDEIININISKKQFDFMLRKELEELAIDNNLI